MFNAFLLRLMHAAELGDQEIQAIEELCRQPRDIGAKKYLSRDGDEMHSFPVVLSGWAARYQILRNGARQITRLLLPGDAFYFDCSPDGIAIEEVITLSPCKIVNITHADMRRLIDRFPTIGEAMRSYGGMENAVLASWVVNVDRRDALERMAHLICETQYRLSLVDAHPSQQIYFPLTQDDLADVLGLTPVHINRKLQQLRQDGLITLRSKQLTIHDLRMLQQIAGFDPSYLAPRIQTLRERERLRIIAA
ncbi:Crp/Fnr family transcriptional regulator [Erythrobacter sp. CCH5-A1]|uniref:Crp/Fnr family transcriptional regulator n=1 Tax=Erythrobacter sp. CCH5-A1 TaxID=1768792 RepID=UPI000835C728|nr:Crp/Fnr family transcriptional regulator [Erythrobacter sp. CCH5-A1]